MNSPLSAQANKVWQLLTASSTITTYKQAIDLTWLILKEIGHLIWLIVCVALVGWDWFWHQSIQLGQKTRAWVDEFTTRKSNSAGHADSGDSAYQVWHNLLASTKTASSSLLSKARQELNLSTPTAPQPTTAPKPTTVTPTPKVSPPPSDKTP